MNQQNLGLATTADLEDLYRFDTPIDACSSYADCSGGELGFCLIKPGEIKDGYCTVKCGETGMCPAGSTCGGTNCLKTCNDDNDCRGEGYACADIGGDNTKECFVSATGTGEVGDPCINRWDCGGGALGGCLFEEADGLWSGGYCTLECTPGPTRSCPGDSRCFDAASPFCVDGCTMQSDCRENYECARLITTAPQGEGQCIPDNI